MLNAFISSYSGDKNAALNILAGLDLPSLAPAFMVVAHLCGPEGAVAGYRLLESTADLDSDGKYYFCCSRQRPMGSSKRSSDALTGEDFRDSCSISYQGDNLPPHVRFLTNFVKLYSQVPFDAASFPLASDAAGLQARRVAYRHLPTQLVLRSS
jgi:hypothetical protein